MTPELIGIITATIALAALILNQSKRLEQRLADLHQQIENIKERIGNITERLTRQVGLIQGLYQNRSNTPSPINPEHHGQAA